MSESATCPRCAAKGRAVQPVTLESLLVDTARARLSASSEFRFCKTPDCDVVYFSADGGTLFTTSDLAVTVFQKSEDPSRYVCYCFEHTVESIENEVHRTGTSRVPDQIADLCKQGLDRCEETNPQGSCCLGNVRRVVKEAGGGASPDDATPTAGDADSSCSIDASGSSCCVPKDAEPTVSERVEAKAESEAESGSGTGAGSGKRPRNPGLWSVGGAVTAAVLSSACCWLPLVLIGVGVSSAGVAGFLGNYRPWFLGAAALFLGLGFYLVYVRTPECAPGDACSVPDPRRRRLNRIMLWVSAGFVVAFAAFPGYVGVFFGGGGGKASAVQMAGVAHTYRVEGMTCEGCSARVRQALEAIPGVAAVDVSFADRQARVTFKPGTVAEDDSILTAISALGYRASVQPPAGPDR